MNDTDKMIPLDEALRIVDETLADVRLPTERVPVRDALGRALAADQVSRLDLPPFNKSAMDGYAILPDDERDEYRLLETIAAGELGAKQLVPGCTVKVMTGAAVPEGTGRVIIVEHADEKGDLVRVHKHGGPANICPKAEDVRVGDTVLPAGTTLRALAIANLISCGVSEVEVARRVRVAIVSTGDEIVDSPELLTLGKIMNANGPLLAGLAREHGIEVVSEEVVADDRNATAAVMRFALERADVLLISGGVSAGDFDFVIEALSDVGLRLHFSRVAIKPGKPMTYASGGGKVVLGLPGNPASAYLTFHLFALRVTALLTGAPHEMREFSLRLARDLKRRRAERREYMPCRLTEEGFVEPLEYHGSAHLTALTDADGFFVVPIGVAELAAGDEVTFVPAGLGQRV